MQIGIDATALPPQPVGAGNYIIQLIRALVAGNDENRLVIFAQDRGPKLINLPSDSPVEWHIVQDSSPVSRLIWEQTVLPGLVEKSRIDLLHSLHYTKPLRLSCSSVVTFHDMTYYLFPQMHTWARRMVFPPVMRISAKQADALISVSESTRLDMIRLLEIDPGKIITTHLGVDSSFKVIDDEILLLEVVSKYSLPENFILYLGTIEPRKNLPLLISAYKQLVDGGIAHKLVLVGKYGWMYHEVLDLIKKLDLQSMVVITGYIPQDDLPLIYNLASLFVYPTIYEGFGLPALEAMACGVPVITSRIASLPEIVGDAGYLVSVDHEGELIEAMGQVLEDIDLQEELIHKGLDRSELFTWERTAQLTQTVYRKVLEQK